MLLKADTNNTFIFKMRKLKLSTILTHEYRQATELDMGFNISLLISKFVNINVSDPDFSTVKWC